MIALFYVLGFLSGAALAVVVWLIQRSKAAKSSSDELGRGFMNILNY